MPGPASCLPASDTYNDKFLSHYALYDIQHNIWYDMSNVLMYSSNCETATNKRWCNTFHTHKKCNLAQVISSTEASHDETHIARRCSPGSVTLTAHAQKEIMRRFEAKASSWGGNMTCCSVLASVQVCDRAATDQAQRLPTQNQFMTKATETACMNDYSQNFKCTLKFLKAQEKLVHVLGKHRWEWVKERSSVDFESIRASTLSLSMPSQL